MCDHYKYIFVVLTYRNAEDLIDFSASLKKCLSNDYRVVVVNSFYDDTTRKRISQIAAENDCDFINIENKGYSYGNNRGIEYVRKHYDYEYLIVSNPDIIVEKLELPKADGTVAIYGPKITTLTGKQQNPYRPVYFGFGEYVSNKGYQKNCKTLVWFNIIVNKILRTIFLMWKHIFQKPSEVYALHGSFLIFTKAVAEMCSPIFYEKMFLFAEEDYLSYRMKCLKIPMVYAPDVRVTHKEDGSIGMDNTNVWAHMQKSYLVYYAAKKGLRRAENKVKNPTEYT